jgi:hypothetical protein
MKIKLVYIFILAISIFACKKEPKNQFECFEEFQKAAMEENHDRLDELTDEWVKSSIKKLKEYKKPYLRQIPEQSDGAYGVKFLDNMTLFYVELNEDFIPKDTFAVGVMYQEGKYKVVNFHRPKTN